MFVGWENVRVAVLEQWIEDGKQTLRPLIEVGRRLQQDRAAIDTAASAPGSWKRTPGPYSACNRSC
ncbi:hypothetical protein [Streptomyces sp. NPDC048665]|uniref:hypothetical protein n=1 Tax=Streptomyces sp. NPDC048665 TaxID=3155490 RepID=UPI003441C2D3